MRCSFSYSPLWFFWEQSNTHKSKKSQFTGIIMPTLTPPPQSLPKAIQANNDLANFFKQLNASIYTIFFELNRFNPSETQDITASDGVAANNRIMRVQGSGGAVTVTATPSIADARDGEELIIQGNSDTNTLTLQDESNLANSGLQLAGGADVTLGKGDTIYLTYDEGDDKWYEISRSNN